MARRRSNRRSDSKIQRRSYISRPTSPRLLSKTKSYRVRSSRQLVLDNSNIYQSRSMPSLFKPKRFYVQPTLQQRRLEPVPSARLVNTLNKLQIGVSKPVLKSLSVCDRRKSRREVLFASGTSSKGARSKKTYQPSSKVKC